MEEDFKLLLSEYCRVATKLNLTDSPALIPVLLKNGAFTPSRLESWPFPQILEEMTRNEGYRCKIIDSFAALITTGGGVSEAPFTLNEKKAVSFLLATRENHPKLLEYLKDVILENVRINIATLEYGLLRDKSDDLRSSFRSINLPCPQIETIAPKLKSKYPTLCSMISDPSTSKSLNALSVLKESLDPLAEFELKCVLDCAARTHPSDFLYEEIISSIWNPSNGGEDKVMLVVIDSMKYNKDLQSFCIECLREEDSENKSENN